MVGVDGGLRLRALQKLKDSDWECGFDDVAMTSASRVAKRLGIVSHDMPVVHWQPSAVTSEVLHHLNDALTDNNRDTASVSCTSERDGNQLHSNKFNTNRRRCCSI